MAFNNSNVRRMRDANNVVYGDQINNVYGSISPKLDDPISEATLQLLANKAAPNACFDSEQRFPPPNCHPGTRASTLNVLSKWVEDNSKITRVFWLFGTAGVGKSAIAQNLAEKYASSRLAAAFFFSRNDSSRDKLDPFVASIAYQFCTPGSRLRSVLGPAIIEAIRSDPNIFHKSCENQFEKLIVEPCSRVDVAEWENLPNVIEVDGLDECVHRPSQERLLALIEKVVTSPTRIPWIFLVFSRPEPQIRDSFGDFGPILRSFDINSTDEARRDIQKYFIDQFTALRKKHHRALRHEGTWPSNNVVDRLVDRADGQFIFAVTVIKYIDTRDERPQDRLDTILRIYVERDSESPYSDLDLLYHQILSTCHRWEKVQPVLRLLLSTRTSPRRVRNRQQGAHRMWNARESKWHARQETPLCSQEVSPRSQEDSLHSRGVSPHPWEGPLSSSDTILHSREISWCSPEMIMLLLDLNKGEVETILSRLYSVLQIPDDNNSDIQIAHASFNEFLSDPNRSEKYHTPKMSESEYNDCVGTLLLRTLSTLKLHYPLYHSQSDFTTTFSWWAAKVQKDRSRELMGYSHFHWEDYCKAVKSPSADICAALDGFDLYSVVAASLFHGFALQFGVWSDAIEWAKSYEKGTQNFIETCKTFLRGFCVAFPPTIQRHKALWWTFEWEQYLLDNGHVNTPQRVLLKKLYSMEEGAVASSLKGHLVLVLPANSGVILPQNWIVTHVTKSNGGVFGRVIDVLKDYENGLEILLKDIQEDSCELVSRNWVKEYDLIHLKVLLKQRREKFFPEYNDWPPDEADYSPTPNRPNTR
ncbi:nacht and wd40 domain-containing protein [Moniliophthora roreri MCA 2997]|uniref:Nacht and wd40 domain-containing protein n=2 Tax=Moniliophthora roreri TaxID=221103 RepID=V2X903_MONRO|nr:nacht and wd40 domain-containing protein [Moniliophthora roreri MCA 2997]